jgi:hypothetical protein
MGQGIRAPIDASLGAQRSRVGLRTRKKGSMAGPSATEEDDIFFKEEVEDAVEREEQRKRRNLLRTLREESSSAEQDEVAAPHYQTWRHAQKTQETNAQKRDRYLRLYPPARQKLKPRKAERGE